MKYNILLLCISLLHHGDGKEGCACGINVCVCDFGRSMPFGWACTRSRKYDVRSAAPSILDSSWFEMRFDIFYIFTTAKHVTRTTRYSVQQTWARTSKSNRTVAVQHVTHARISPSVTSLLVNGVPGLVELNRWVKQYRSTFARGMLLYPSAHSSVKIRTFLKK